MTKKDRNVFPILIHDNFTYLFDNAQKNIPQTT